MKLLRVLSGTAALCAALTVSQSAQAGFGLFGFHGGHGSYGSSGGYALGVGSAGGSGGSYGSSGAYAGGSSGYAVGYGSYGGGYGASYGSYGGLGSGGTAHVGPIRRLKARIHAHHAAKVAARSGVGYGSSGAVAVYRESYGSSGGSSGGSVYGSSGGSYSGGSSGSYSGGSSGSYSVGSAPATTSYYSGSSSYETPAVDYHSGDSYAPTIEGETIIDGGYESGTAIEPMEPVVDPAAEASISVDAALITIAVPESATVVVNGIKTSSRGEVRQFMSNGLKEGFVYTYEVEVNFANGAQPAKKTVKLRAGASERLVFDEPETSGVTASTGASPETVVTLRVPADAKVNLAGNATNGSGDVRTFRTRQLAEGQKWSGYTISVTSIVNGQEITKEKTIDLVAGSDHEFEFTFDDSALASR